MCSSSSSTETARHAVTLCGQLSVTCSGLAARPCSAVRSSLTGQPCSAVCGGLVWSAQHAVAAPEESFDMLWPVLACAYLCPGQFVLCQSTSPGRFPAVAQNISRNISRRSKPRWQAELRQGWQPVCARSCCCLEGEGLCSMLLCAMPISCTLYCLHHTILQHATLHHVRVLTPVPLPHRPRNLGRRRRG